MIDAVYAPGTAKKRKNRIFTLFVIIIAVLSAIVLWIYVLGYDSPNYEKEFNVTVTAEGESKLREEKNYTIISDFGFSIKVTVSGPQTEVNMLRAEDIRAYIDVSGVTTRGSNSLPIYVVLPNENKLAVTAKSSESAVVFIDECISARIPVRVEFSDYTLAADLTLGDYTTTPVSVEVEGPKSMIDTIEYAYAPVTLPREISGSVKVNTSVSLRNSNGNVVNNSYLVLKTPSVEVSVPVEKTKNVPVKVYFVGGYFGTDSAVITLSHEYIRVKGVAEAVDQLDEIKISVVENRLVTDEIVKNITFPAGVESADGVTSVTAKIVFNDLVRRTISLYTDQCEFTNKPESISVIPVDQVINVTVVGPSQSVSMISFEDFAIRADLSYIDLEPGKEYSVPLEIDFAAWNEIFNGVFVSGDYDIRINTGSTEQ